MFWFWFTLVADAYPLICWFVSSPSFDHIQAPEPGCWFSRTTGLSTAGNDACVSPTTSRRPRSATIMRRWCNTRSMPLTFMGSLSNARGNQSWCSRELVGGQIRNAKRVQRFSNRNYPCSGRDRAFDDVFEEARGASIRCRGVADVVCREDEP